MKRPTIIGGAAVAIVAVVVFFVSTRYRNQRRDASAVKLYQLGCAASTCNSALQSVDDIRDKSGKPLLSWRVKILPYLDQAVLFEKFHLDEPWDSPSNKILLREMPSCYLGDAESGVTPYRVFRGPHALFPESGGAKLDAAAVPDGMEATILAVEAADAVPWTKPEDIPYSPTGALPALSRAYRDGALAVFADRTVRSIPYDTDEQTIRALITPNGAETISLDRFPVNQAAEELKRGAEAFAKQFHR
jgi:hypothetical protein